MKSEIAISIFLYHWKTDDKKTDLDHKLKESYIILLLIYSRDY